MGKQEKDINLQTVNYTDLGRKRINNHKMYTYMMLAVLCVAYATAGLPGGVEEMNMKEILTNKELLAGLDQEIERFNSKRYNEFRVVRHSIVSATKQVVEGMMYQIKINTVESNCKNIKENDGKTIEECPAKAGKQTLLCLVSVWSRSWESPEKKLVTSMKCLRKMENGGRGGQVEEMTMDEILANKELLAGLDQEVERFNSKRFNDFRVVRHSIVSATKQVVSGMMYQVKVKTVESECKNVKE